MTFRPDGRERSVVNGLAEAAFRAHYDDVLRFIRRRTRTAAEAEEPAQAVFADAVARLRAFVLGETPVLAWLYTVSHSGACR
jgi:DNA-directed RNA polymerase specialized sigma24 family protein